jgi:hypothetical protein
MAPIEWPTDMANQHLMHSDETSSDIGEALRFDVPFRRDQATDIARKPGFSSSAFSRRRMGDASQLRNGPGTFARLLLPSLLCGSGICASDVAAVAVILWLPAQLVA